MASFVVYDTLLGTGAAAHCRKVRIDKHVSLEEAKRSAQLRFIRYARGPQPDADTSLERVTVETNDGQIVFELPSVSVH